MGHFLIPIISARQILDLQYDLCTFYLCRLPVNTLISFSTCIYKTKTKSEWDLFDMPVSFYTLGYNVHYVKQLKTKYM